MKLTDTEKEITESISAYSVQDIETCPSWLKERNNIFEGYVEAVRDFISFWEELKMLRIQNHKLSDINCKYRDEIAELKKQLEEKEKASSQPMTRQNIIDSVGEPVWDNKHKDWEMIVSCRVIKNSIDIVFAEKRPIAYLLSLVTGFEDNRFYRTKPEDEKK